MKQKEALKLVKAYIKKIEKFVKPKEVYLFGSYANGVFIDYSDIDVAIVLEHYDDYKELTKKLYEIACEMSNDLEPHLFFEDDPDIERKKFFQRILDYGVKIK